MWDIDQQHVFIPLSSGTKQLLIRYRKAMPLLVNTSGSPLAFRQTVAWHQEELLSSRLHMAQRTREVLGVRAPGSSTPPPPLRGATLHQLTPDVWAHFLQEKMKLEFLEKPSSTLLGYSRISNLIQAHFWDFLEIACWYWPDLAIFQADTME